MTPLEAEALLIRHRAAVELLESRDVEGVEALLMVLAPDGNLLRASLAAAKRDGISVAALRAAGKRAYAGDRLPAQVSLTDLASRR